MQCEPEAFGSRVWYNVPGTWLDNVQCGREGMVIPNCGAEYGKGYITYYNIKVPGMVKGT